MRSTSRILRLTALAAAVAIVAAACGDTTSTSPPADNGESAVTQQLPPDSPEDGTRPGDEAEPPVTAVRPGSLVPATERPIPVEVTPAPAPRDPVAVAVPEVLEGVIAKAKQVLVDDYSAVEADIVVVSWEPAVWPDAGLGCPQPGMEYLQVQVEGSIIELVHDGALFTFHSDGKRVVLCPQV